MVALHFDLTAGCLLPFGEARPREMLDGKGQTVRRARKGNSP